MSDELPAGDDAAAQLSGSAAYAAALDWLYSAQMFGIKLGLAGMSHLLECCGVSRPHARVIHVAGTNGKGSTCAFAESVARAAGYKTGLFTSPHLVRFNERIRVAGQCISDADAARLINHLRDLVADWETPPTFFELTLALAMLYFEEQGVEIIILETGLGGRLDATNAVPKDVAVLTPIGMDHTQFLGSSLYEIAHEKAAIFSWHRPALTAPQQPEAMRAIHEAAHACDVDYRVIAEECELPLGLAGAHQRQNAALALVALRALPHFLCSEEELAHGLATTCWPGRFEELMPGVILDGAHNPPAMHTLVSCWQQRFGSVRARCIFAGSADKDLDSVLELLAPIVEEWVLPPVSSPRILPQAELSAKVRATGASRMSTPASLAEAVADLREPTLICGSFFLLGEVMALLQHMPYRHTAQ